MKLLIKGIVFILLCYNILSLTLKAETGFSTIASKQANYWKTLFGSVERPVGGCFRPAFLRRDKPEWNAMAEHNFPTSKSNIWDKKCGEGPSAYFFDYLDPLLQATITKEFENMYKAARALKAPPKKLYTEPYSLDRLLLLYTQSAPTDPDQPTKNTANMSARKKIEKIRKYNPKFSGTNWDQGLTCGQIRTLFETWGWNLPNKNDDWAKKIVDQFDFDGDGKIGIPELILMSIVVNKGNYRNPQCKKFCYSKIMETLLEPIFDWVDCDGDGNISAENLWIGLQGLKRPNGKFNIYRCMIPTQINKFYHTTACNDFILKNNGEQDGFITKNEFLMGVLFGYLNRQVREDKVYLKDERNDKNKRWGFGGTRDIACKNVRKLVPTKVNYPSFPLKFDSPAVAKGAKEGGEEGAKEGGEEGGEEGAKEGGEEGAKEGGEEGAKEEGAKEEGAKEEGAKDEGAKEEGAKEEGAKEEGAKEEGAKEEGAKEGGEEAPAS